MFLFEILGWVIFNPLVWIVLIIIWLSRRNKHKGTTSASANTSYFSDELRAQIARDELTRLATDPRASRYSATITKLQVLLGASSASNGAVPAASTTPTVQQAPPAISREKVKFNWFDQRNINVLLYLGAFLVLAAIGVFVLGFWQTIGDVTKMVMVTALVVAFYSVGLNLYRNKEVYKEAGLTLFIIGLIGVPALGLAYSNFITHGQQSSEIWLGTSLLTLVLYGFSLRFVAKNYIAGITALAGASLLASLVYLITADMTYTIWTLPISAGAIYLAGEQFRTTRADIYSAFKPVAVGLALVSAFLAGSQPAINLAMGVDLLLMAAFFGLAYDQEKAPNDKLVMLVLALIALPAGVWSLSVHNNFSSEVIAGILASIGLIYAIATYLVDPTNNESKALSILSMTLLFLGLMEANNQYPISLGIALLATAAAAALFWRIKRGELLYPAAVFSGIALFYMHTKLLFDGASYYYLGYTWFLAFVAWYLISWSQKGRNSAGRWAGAAAAVVFAVLALMNGAGDAATAFFISLLLMLSVAGIAELEGQPHFHSATVFLSHIVVLAALSYLDMRGSDYSYYFMGLSVFWYLIGISIKQLGEERSKIFRYGALVSQALAGFFTLEYSNGVSILSNYILAGLLAVEAVTEHKGAFGYAASAVFMLAFERHLAELGFSETQVFMVPLGIYFAVLAALRARKDAGQKDLFTGLSLGVFTVPLFFQSTGGGELALLYALVLGIEAIIIVLAGISLSYRMMIVWGVIALIVDVLYQTRDLILVQWVLYLLIGIGLIGGAMYLLKRRAEDQAKLPPPPPPKK